MDHDAFIEGRLDELVAGVGYQGRARIGDKRDRLALPDSAQEARPDGPGVVLVIRREPGIHIVAGQQLGGVAGIFGRNDIG